MTIEKRGDTSLVISSLIDFATKNKNKLVASIFYFNAKLNVLFLVDLFFKSFFSLRGGNRRLVSYGATSKKK